MVIEATIAHTVGEYRVLCFREVKPDHTIGCYSEIWKDREHLFSVPKMISHAESELCVLAWEAGCSYNNETRDEEEGD